MTSLCRTAAIGRSRRVFFRVGLGLPVLVTFWVSHVSGQTRVWNATGTASWTGANNWTPMMVPDSNSDAFINNGGTAQLAGTSGQARDIYVGGPSGASGVLEVAGTAIAVLTSRQAFVGDAGTGIATVSGGGARWTNTSEMTIGRAGGGALFILAGADVTASRGYLGREVSGFGTMTVSGDGSTWTGPLEVGRAAGAEGTIHLLNTAAAFSSSATLGLLSGSVGTVNVEDSSWNVTGLLEVGRSGMGTLNMKDGIVTSGSGYVGIFANSDGAVLVDDFSSWTISGPLRVGADGGSGVVQAIGGGEIISASAVIGGERLDGFSPA
jgi:T5SS/PEP-CTERM-associated repeat protein